MQQVPSELPVRSSPYPEHETPTQSSSGSTIQNTDPVIRDDANEAQASSPAEPMNVDATTNDPSLETLAFGHHSRRLIETIQKLENLGIDATLTSLPKFVVVGDQSHGKSSIIEAICQISLPRSEGTCTRCPFQITTSAGKHNGQAWSCEVSLMIRHGYENGKWVNTQSQNTVQFAHIYDKSKLERTLRLAQLAILNPQVDPVDIKTANDLDRGHAVHFSPNVIGLKIICATLPELSFFDLPGAINMHEDANEQKLVGLIEKLTKHYVKDEKALILLAVSANVDTETSTAFKYISQSNAQNKALNRTMGVITKPDLLSKSAQQLRRLLVDEIFRLGNGWYVSKQLSQQEIETGVSYIEARERERSFFATQEPWCSSLSEFGSRFGTVALQEALSKKLTQHILDYLPDITSRVERKLREIECDLSTFPERVKAPSLTVSNEIDRLTRKITAHLHSHDYVNESKQFRDEYKDIIKGLQKDFKDGRPTVILSTPGYKQPTISLDSDDEEESTEATDESPTKFRRGNDGERQASRAPSAVKTEKDGVSSCSPPAKQAWRLDQLQRILHTGSNSGIGEINSNVTDYLAMQCLNTWPERTKLVLSKAENLLANMITGSISNVLAGRENSLIFEETGLALQKLFSEIISSQQKDLEYLIKCETYRPITYDITNLRQAKLSITKALQDRRLKLRIDEHFDTIEAQGAKATKPEDRQKKARDADWIHQTLGNDKFARETTLMAAPLAYYDIASIRFVDTVALHLESGLLRALEERLKEALHNGLQAWDVDHCAKLLAEDPVQEARRSKLIVERQNLLEAIKELRSLPAS